MNDIAIQVKNLTKTYSLYEKPIDRLKEALHPWRKSYNREFKALNDVSFEIKKGQTVGIIGKNGSGKSTLLKIIAGVLTPTSGEAQVKGSVSALLELGAGFNPELTGFENIYLNGNLMGFSKNEMDARLSEILDFADIGDFVHQPVKMYSSGMFIRLAFAVAIAVEPEILIVDEALSVGDIFFQSKCYAYFEKLKEQGKTILFVTHSLDAVIRNCSRAFCIEEGKITASGAPSEVVDFYKKQRTGHVHKENVAIELGQKWSNSYILNNSCDSYGSHEVFIEDFAILDCHGIPQSVFFQGDMVELALKVKVNKPIRKLIGAFAIKTPDGLEVLGSNTAIMKRDLHEIVEAEQGEIRFKFPLFLQSSEYTLSLGLTHIDECGELHVYHRMYNVVSLVVNSVFGGTGIYTPSINLAVNIGVNEQRN
ncbi:MAG TPA: ABC transporter ATP-binding protein [Pseudobdellovibrionaceae bacterium]|jgi:teichoic acid transport system ATP-binding protein